MTTPQLRIIAKPKPKPKHFKFLSHLWTERKISVILVSALVLSLVILLITDEPQEWVWINSMALIFVVLFGLLLRWPFGVTHRSVLHRVINPLYTYAVYGCVFGLFVFIILYINYTYVMNYYTQTDYMSTDTCSSDDCDKKAHLTSHHAAHADVRRRWT